MISGAWAEAVGAAYTPQEQRTDAQREAKALADALAAELRAADHVVLAFPLYNYGISQHAKVWIDLAIAGGTLGERLLDGKPVVLVTTRGGAYGAGTPREGWDHAEQWLPHGIGMTGLEPRFITAELTLAHSTPAMADLIPLAHQSRADAEAVIDALWAPVAAAA